MKYGGKARRKRSEHTWLRGIEREYPVVVSAALGDLARQFDAALQQGDTGGAGPSRLPEP